MHIYGTFKQKIFGKYSQNKLLINKNKNDKKTQNIFQRPKR